jgi:hypothetical protein
MNTRQGERHSDTAKDFHGRRLPEPAKPVGYAALIDRYSLRVPLPSQLALSLLAGGRGVPFISSSNVTTW